VVVPLLIPNVVCYNFHKELLRSAVSFTIPNSIYVYLQKINHLLKRRHIFWILLLRSNIFKRANQRNGYSFIWLHSKPPSVVAVLRASSHSSRAVVVMMALRQPVGLLLFFGTLGRTGLLYFGGAL
jgi:hypothetical protein